jgi:hypothetical protein
MAFRSDDQDFRWPHHGDRPHRQEHHELARGESEELSLSDTLREIAVTIAAFAGVIVLTIAVLGAFRV